MMGILSCRAQAQYKFESDTGNICLHVDSVHLCMESPAEHAHRLLDKLVSAACAQRMWVRLQSTHDGVDNAGCCDQHQEAR
jgi:phage FluMu gp28-like protein